MQCASNDLFKKSLKKNVKATLKIKDGLGGNHMIWRRKKNCVVNLCSFEFLEYFFSLFLVGREGVIWSGKYRIPAGLMVQLCDPADEYLSPIWWRRGTLWVSILASGTEGEEEKMLIAGRHLMKMLSNNEHFNWDRGRGSVNVTFAH